MSKFTKKATNKLNFLLPLLIENQLEVFVEAIINVNVNMYICARLMMYKITRLLVQDVA